MINETMLSQVAEFYRNHAADPRLVEGLKSSFPGLHFTVCDDDDVIGARPVYTEQGLKLYLVGGGHCLSLTTDMQEVTGMVLGEVHEEDED